MKKLTFCNLAIEGLGVFKQRQDINLVPSQKKRITLVEGMNGCGKTTFLLALQIALFGERLFRYKKDEYTDLIKGLIRSDVQKNPMIEATINLIDSTASVQFTVRREWNRNTKNLKEIFSLFLDDNSINWEVSQWDSFIDAYIPVDLADLFFFDGEKIEAMANPERMPAILKKATQSLLGVGQLEDIIVDLRAYERRQLLQVKESNPSSSIDRKDLEDKNLALKESERQIEFLRLKEAECMNTVDSQLKNLQACKESANKAGLAAFHRAQAKKELAHSLLCQIEDTKKERIEMVSDSFYPLLRFNSVRTQLLETLREEARIPGEDAFLQVHKCEKRLLDKVIEKIPNQVESIKEILSEINRDLGFLTKKHKELVQIIPEVVDEKIAQLSERKQKIENKLQNLEESLEKVHREIDEAPTEEKVTLLLSQISEKESALADARIRLMEVKKQIALAEVASERLVSQVQSIEERLRRDFKETDRLSYVMGSVSRAREVISLYEKELLARKAVWLSHSICEQFCQLLRKKNLVSEVKVNPETYEVQLVQRNGEEKDVSSLSAGERQILATALLRAVMNGKKTGLPVVVDTPLARLDAAHRMNLMKKFYKEVSHQVIILSTDEEISGALREEISSTIGHAYRFVFDEKEQATTVVEMK